MKMPFGKHRGIEIEQIEASYLWWLLERGGLDYTLRNQILSVLRQRLGHHDMDSINEPYRPVDSHDVITKWRRRMSMEFHPDRGGNHQAMLIVNKGIEILKDLLQ